MLSFRKADVDTQMCHETVKMRTLHAFNTEHQAVLRMTLTEQRMKLLDSAAGAVAGAVAVVVVQWAADAETQ